MADAIRGKRQLAPAVCRPFPLVPQPFDQTVIAASPHLPTNRGTPGTIAASLSVIEPQHSRRGTSPGIRRTWLVVAGPSPPESAAIPAIPSWGQVAADSHVVAASVTRLSNKTTS